MSLQPVCTTLKRFILIEQCPPDWQDLDLYLFRDDAVAFYVGQSQLAFARVWDHLMAGFKGHSLVGRFMWVNWPASMNFTIELSSSRSPDFAACADLNAAEAALIRHWSPCLNVSLNSQPTPLPARYLPPNAPFRRRQGFRSLTLQAARAVQQEDAEQWVAALARNERP